MAELELQSLVRQRDAMLAQKTSGGLRMLDGASLNALMHPPKYLRDAVAAETQVYSLAAPPKAK